MGFDIKKENLTVIALANPLVFGFSFVGIAFTKDRDNCLLLAFRKEKLVLQKYYKQIEWAKRAFRIRFAKEPKDQPEWFDSDSCFNLKGKIEQLCEEK